MNNQIIFDHSSFIVPDLEKAIDFFESVLGYKLESKYGPIANNGNDMEEIFGVPKEAVARFCFLTKDGSNKVELVEWTVSGRRIRNQFDEINTHHIAFLVEDLSSVIAQLKKRDDITFLKRSPHNFIYFMTDFGLQVQLIERK